MATRTPSQRDQLELIFNRINENRKGRGVALVARNAFPVSYSAQLRETTFDRSIYDPTPFPQFRTYETVFVQVEMLDGSVRSMSNEEAQSLLLKEDVDFLLREILNEGE